MNLSEIREKLHDIVESAQTGPDTLIARCEVPTSLLEETVKVMRAAEAENVRLREALRWYADRTTYDLIGAPRESATMSNGDVVFTQADEGERARAALGEESK